MCSPGIETIGSKADAAPEAVSAIRRAAVVILRKNMNGLLGPYRAHGRKQHLQQTMY
jgi:hypothetical protein